MRENGMQHLEEELKPPSKSKRKCFLQKLLITFLSFETEKFFGVRHIQAALLFFMIVIAYGMRVNLSVTIVAMTDPAATVNPNIPVSKIIFNYKKNKVNSFRRISGTTTAQYYHHFFGAT